MEIKITQGVVVNGNPAKKGQKVEVDKKTAAYLVAKGKAEYLDKKEEFDIDELLDTEDFNTLTVPKLKAVCAYYGLEVSGHKEDFVKAIEEMTGSSEDD